LSPQHFAAPPPVIVQVCWLPALIGDLAGASTIEIPSAADRVAPAPSATETTGL